MQQLAFLRTFKNSWAASKAGYVRRSAFFAVKEQSAISRGTKQQKILQGIVQRDKSKLSLCFYFNSKVDFKVATFNWNRIEKEKGKIFKLSFPFLFEETGKKESEKNQGMKMNVDDQRKRGGV